MAVRICRFDRWGNQIGTLNPYFAEWTEELNGQDTVNLKMRYRGVEKGDRIVWRDHNGAWHEHIAYNVRETHDADGYVCDALCENSISELYGDVVLDRRPTNCTVADALSAVVNGADDLHSNDTRWSVGTANVDGLHSISFYRESCRECIADVVDKWGGELSTTIEVSGTEVTSRKVNVTVRGSDKGRRFEYTRDMKEISRTADTSSVVTAMYGFGKGEDVGDGYGRRIDLSESSAYIGIEDGIIHDYGEMYVYSDQAKEQWGRPDGSGVPQHVYGQVTFSDCEDREELLNLTIDSLRRSMEPLLSYEADVDEFMAYGYDFSDCQLGDVVSLIDSDSEMKLRANGRVTKAVRDLMDDCSATSITIGNIVEDASSIIADQIGAYRDTERRSSAWDVAAFTTDSYMQHLVDRFNGKFEDGGVYKYESFDDGTIYSSVPLDANLKPTSAPAMAFQLKGGGFRISNAVDSDGNFVWTTMADGNGIIAGSIVTGLLSDASGLNYWNLDTGEFHLSSYAPASEATGEVVVEYALGDSRTDAPDTGWAVESPVWTEGKYVWQRTKTATVDGKVYYSSPVCIQGAQGEPGLPGAPGEPGRDGEDGTSVKILGSYDTLQELQAAHPTGENGDSYIVGDDLYVWTGTQWINVGAIKGPAGESAYVHFAYSTSSDGSAGFSLVAYDGAKYIGVRTDTVKEDSTDYRDYSWTRIQGEQGPAGTGVMNVVNYYLASPLSSGVTTSTPGWTTAVQDVTPDKKYLWNYEVVQFTNDSTSATEPCIIGAYGESGEDGSDGRGISSITEYYLLSSQRTGITTSTSGWSTTPSVTTEDTPYLWNYEKVAYTDGTTVSTTPVVVGVHGAKGPQGAPGTSVSGVVNYYLASSAKSGVTTSTSGWTTSVQSVSADKKYLWNYEVVHFSDGTTAATEPCIIGAYGDQGSNGATGRGISSITEYYLTTNASSGVTTSTSGWSTTPTATTPDKKYLWNYEKVAYTDGTSTSTTPAIVGMHGETGTGVSNVVAQYYLSTSNTSQTGGSWSTTQPAWAKGKYIWTRTAVTWTDGTTTYTTPVLAQAINSANESANDAKDAVESLDASLNSEGVFNRLTNNGAMQGIFMENGQLYMNADYIKTGTIVAKRLVDPENSANYGIVGTSGGYVGLNFYPSGNLAYNITASMFSTGKPALFALRVPYTASDGTESSAFAVSINATSITLSTLAYSNNAKSAGSTGTYIQLQATPNGVFYYNEDKAANYKVFAVPGQCDSYAMLSGFTLYRNGATVTLANTGAQSHTIAGNWGGKSLGTIPVGYRPPATLHFNPVAISGMNIYLEVKSDGTCQLVNGESSSYTGIVPVSGTWAMAN